MILHYIKIAWRNLIRHSLYSFINIGGLATGIAACLLILLFVVHEHSYDRFHKDADRIYSMYFKIKMGGDSIQFTGASSATASILQQSDPSVTSSLRIWQPYQTRPVANPGQPGKLFTEDKFFFADSNFFSFFSFHLLQGNPDQVLTRPFTVVISKEMALKYFGKEDPIGKSLRYDSAYTFEVTGVADRIPSNSSLSCDFVASVSSHPYMKTIWQPAEQNNIGLGTYKIYFRLQPNASAGNSESTLNRLAQQSPDFKQQPFRIVTYPFIGTHLENNFTRGEDSRYLSVFPLVAGLILLLALINYMNLSTARAALRAKEVGVRKTNGATRSRLAGQFYVESALYTLIAFALAWVLFRITQPWFLHILGITIDTAFVYQPRMLLMFAGLLIITVVMAGAYPSLILSSFNPVMVLYGRLSRQNGGANLRKTLTVIQFFVSVVLIISSIVIGRQLYFFRHTDTGVQRDNVLTIPFHRSMGNHYQDFTTAVAQMPGVQGVAMANFALYNGYNMMDVTPEHSKEQVMMSAIRADLNFMPLLGIQWKIPPAGSILGGERKVVLNEAAIEKLNLPPNPLGHTIHINNADFTIAGVTRNFNYNRLHSRVEGMCLLIDRWQVEMNEYGYGTLYVKIAKGANVPTTIDAIKKAYDSRDKGYPFEFHFMDETFDAQYQAEDKLAGVLDIFTALTVLIACLGLFGLATFSASRRAKEISIRKVLGAGVNNIVFVLTKDFIQLVLIAIFLAIPVSWYVLHRWLENFAYKIALGWTVFALAALSAIALALLTVGTKAVKAATSNPVKGLRID